MSSEIDIQRFAQLVRAKRGKRGLRVVADEIGSVTASTLSRIENGKVPDLNTFIRICRWLGLPPDYFTATGPDDPSEVSPSTPEIVSLHLRADRTLNAKTAQALVNMVQLAVAAVEDGKLGKRKGKHASGIQEVG
ncbi:MAG: helix-turn-helix transcriptional regulator [Anaerolineales bacterium]|nr:helix-turn-helix transcriptional regulator [Anaerolineales bacterium]